MKSAATFYRQRKPVPLTYALKSELGLALTFPEQGDS